MVELTMVELALDVLAMDVCHERCLWLVSLTSIYSVD
jgi:hypothetical protein